MLSGIAIAYSEFPQYLAKQLPGRVVDREGSKELRFTIGDKPPLLPVQWDGELRVMRWGSQKRTGSLPFGFALSEDWVQSGALDWAKPKEAIVPANLALDRGTWYLVEQGIVAVVLTAIAGGPLVYVLTRPSTKYYQNMTSQAPVQPVLVGQVI